MSEIEKHAGSALALSPDQQTWNDQQRAALVQIGVENASPGDLEVFFHVAQRSGLDPFARQIYMIGREVSVKRNGQWVKEVKQTIQTGIDGYRLIARRAADFARHGLSISAPEFAHPEGGWREFWVSAWGMPLAARVIVRRNGEEFPAVAMFEEYAATKRDGGLSGQWAQRPAGMLAKCAEALALRKAFPQDLSGLYTDEEMDQAGPVVQGEVVTAVEQVETGETMTDNTRRHMFALFGQKGVAEADQLSGINHICGTTYGSRGDLTEADAQRVIAVLKTRPDVATEEQAQQEALAAGSESDAAAEAMEANS